MPIKRITIEASEAALLLGKCVRTCQLLFKKIRVYYGKEKHHVISIEEFCHYMGIKDVEKVRNMLN